MATVLKFAREEAMSLPKLETLAQRRVRVGSRGLEILFGVLFAGFALIMVAGIGAMLFYQGTLIRIGPDGCYIGGGPANSVAFGSLQLDHRLVYVGVGVLRYGPVLMLFQHLRLLFGLYAKGQVFSFGAGRAFGHIGGWLCACALSPLLCHLALSATGYEIDKMWFHIASIQALVLGLLVFVIGQVMQVGRQVQEESEGFV